MKTRDELIRGIGVVGILVATVGLAGCHAAVQKVEMERVDQELSGNRGYFVGTAPAAGARSDHREIAELQVELPSTAAQPKATVIANTSGSNIRQL